MYVNTLDIAHPSLTIGPAEKVLADEFKEVEVINL